LTFRSKGGGGQQAWCLGACPRGERCWPWIN
jgi:hypothetical protein